MVQLPKICEQEKKSKIPICVSRTRSVGGGKSMTMTATLYRNGKSVVEVDAHCDGNWHGLWGRVLAVVRDGDGKACGATNLLHCTTRGGTVDPFFPSSETDIFHLEFLENVARKAVTLDIYQANGGTFEGLRKHLPEAVLRNSVNRGNRAGGTSVQAKFTYDRH